MDVVGQLAHPDHNTTATCAWFPLPMRPGRGWRAILVREKAGAVTVIPPELGVDPEAGCGTVLIADGNRGFARYPLPWLYGQVSS